MSSKDQKIFVVDERKCDGCRECEKACSHKHFGVCSPRHSRIRIEAFGDGDLFVPVFCQACGDPLCIKVCPMNARIELANGAVVTDEDRCIGCRTCVYICPVGAPVENPVSGKLMTCDRCAEDEELPLCVQACSKQQALRFVDARVVARTTARECAARLKAAYKPPKVPE
ncbi:MAG: 4Fe-4S dicluster domain-containing protein [Desulfobacterales bacterium]|nr:MAG: 4Fe-4S dicluster domain-containing protein [Desulfobacterales bacterium]